MAGVLGGAFSPGSITLAKPTRRPSARWPTAADPIQKRGATFLGVQGVARFRNNPRHGNPEAKAVSRHSQHGLRNGFSARFARAREADICFTHRAREAGFFCAPQPLTGKASAVILERISAQFSAQDQVQHHRRPGAGGRRQHHRPGAVLALDQAQQAPRGGIFGGISENAKPESQ